MLIEKSQVWKTTLYRFIASRETHLNNFLPYNDTPQLKVNCEIPLRQLVLKARSLITIT